VYKQVLIDAKLKTGKRGKKYRYEWGEFMKEVKVCIIL